VACFGLELFPAFRVNFVFCSEDIMSTRSLDIRDLNAKAIVALEEAQNMPPGPERTKALNKADRLRFAADIQNYLFSSELKPPE
jgi:hypothetical protein